VAGGVDCFTVKIIRNPAAPKRWMRSSSWPGIIPAQAVRSHSGACLPIVVQQDALILPPGLEGTFGVSPVPPPGYTPNQVAAALADL